MMNMVLFILLVIGIGCVLKLIWNLIRNRSWIALTCLLILISLSSGLISKYQPQLQIMNTNILSLLKSTRNNATQLWTKSGVAKSFHHSSIKYSTDDKQILKQLEQYTNKSSAGPTQNYYWKAGTAQLVSDSDIKNGHLSFSTDSQGRASIARGKLTYKMYSTSKGTRQGEPLDPPNGGWPSQNPKVTISFGLTGRIYHGYMYNRSHSIADSLGGKATYSSANDFTTGTRTQNVGADQNGGMRAAEEIAENYWYSHPNSSTIIEYQTTPLYKGTEKIPRGSIIDEKSSDGVINVRIVVINSVEGYHINYNTGAVTK